MIIFFIFQIFLFINTSGSRYFYIIKCDDIILISFSKNWKYETLYNDYINIMADSRLYRPLYEVVPKKSFWIKMEF